jgi:hypothetical protein
MAIRGGIWLYAPALHQADPTAPRANPIFRRTTTMRHRLEIAALGLAVLFLWAVTPSAAGVVFADSTFNLANYNEVTWVSNSNPTISADQTLTGGNPGPALQILTTSTANFDSYQGFVNTSFVYDPTTQGAIKTINASMDKYFGSNVALLSNFVRPLILQNGMYYVAPISVPSTLGVWLTGSQNGLTASDFVLLSFTNGQVDSTQHPNFAGSVMEFGLANHVGDTFTSGFGNAQNDIRYDNLRLQLNTPEPTSLALFASSALGAIVFSRRRKASAA